MKPKKIRGDISVSITNLLETIPISKRISIIWKYQPHVTSHAAAGSFPITPGYRKWRGDGNQPLSLLGREEETDSDNRAFLYLYGTTLPRVERQNLRG
jgi:hypothetical protein